MPTVSSLMKSNEITFICNGKKKTYSLNEETCRRLSSYSEILRHSSQHLTRFTQSSSSVFPKCVTFPGRSRFTNRTFAGSTCNSKTNEKEIRNQLIFESCKWNDVVSIYCLQPMKSFQSRLFQFDVGEWVQALLRLSEPLTRKWRAVAAPQLPSLQCLTAG